MSEIKNIIFDLGGVIINLDIPKTIAEFNKFSKKPFEEIYTQLQQNPVFDLFDKGHISEADFFNELNKAIENDVPHQQLRYAWDAMLLDFPKYRLDLLESLKPKYHLFLLSNTNETHVQTFEADLYKQHGYQNLDSFFEKVYYSCRVGMRKPDKEIFEMVLTENNLNTKETLFIDDSPQHVEGALNVGIKALLLAKNKEVGDLLLDHNIL